MRSPCSFVGQFHQMEHPDFISGQPPPRFLLPACLSTIPILHVCLVKDVGGGSSSRMCRLYNHVTMFSEGNSGCSVSEHHFDSFALVMTGSCQPYLRADRPHLRFLPAHLQHSTAMPLLLTAPTVSSFVDFGATCSPVKTLFAQHTYYPPRETQGRYPHGTANSEQRSPHLRLET